MAKGKNFGGFGGGMNMQAMMKQAQKMQENMLKAQEEIAVMETTGTAGGGMVTAVVTGTSTLKSIEIKPDVVDPDDIDMLQDLVVAAVNEALKAATEKSQSQMSALTAASAAVWAACCNGLLRTTGRAADRGVRQGCPASARRARSVWRSMCSICQRRTRSASRAPSVRRRKRPSPANAVRTSRTARSARSARTSRATRRPSASWQTRAT